MSRPPTEHPIRCAGRFRTPAANRLVRAVCIALLAACTIPLHAQPPATIGGTSTRARTTAGAPGDQAPSPLPADGVAEPDAAAQPDGVDTAGSATFVGPPEPPWLFGPPAPGIEELAEGLYVATGYGGNVVARVTPEGVVIAGELSAAAETIAARVASVADEPIRYVVRTHRRNDEPPALPAPWGNARLVAPEPPATGVAGAAARTPPVRPDLSFTRGLSLFLGEAEVRLRHFAPAHTGHDAIVLFPDLGVLYAGELVVRGMPFIDYAAGGSSRGWVETLNGILALEFDTVVPGAGPALTKRDVQVFRDRFVTLRMRTMQLLYRDVAREDALPLLQTTDLDWPRAAGGPFAARSFAALYDELAGEREEARAAAALEPEEDSEETARP